MRFIRNPVGYPLHSDLSNDEPTADERLFAGYVLQVRGFSLQFSWVFFSCPFIDLESSFWFLISGVELFSRLVFLL